MATPARQKFILKAASLPEPAEGDDSTSTQPPDEGDRWTPEEAVPPPEDLERLASLTTLSRTRRSCIAAIVGNTVGLGYDLEAVEGREDEVNEDLIREARLAIESYSRRDLRLGRPNFRRQISAVKWDEQEVGNGFLEVSRNKVTGKVNGTYHVIGKRTRRLKTRDGWIVGRRDAPLDEMVSYYDFGSKVEYDDDGVPQPKLAGGSKRWAVNELIPFQLYTSESRDYGLPPDAQLVWDYLGDQRAAESNAAFFDGSGVPPTLLFVKGTPSDDITGPGPVEVEIDPRTIQAISDTLRTDSSIQRRVAVIPLPEGVEVTDVQLALRADRDIGFVEFRRDNRRATLGAFRLAPIFVADIEDTNYSTAETERAVTKEQVFDPEQERTADILTATLLADMGLPMLRFKFRQIAIEGADVARQSANDAADRGAIQYGEYREAHGFGPLPEAKEGAEPEGGEVEFGWNTRLMEAKAGGAVPPPNDPAAPPEAGVQIEDLAKLADGDLFAESVEDALHRVAQQIGPNFQMRPVVVEKDGSSIVVKPYNTSNGVASHA